MGFAASSPIWHSAAREPKVEWSAMALFLVTFVFGAGVIAWMLAQVVAASKNPAPK